MTGEFLAQQGVVGPRKPWLGKARNIKRMTMQGPAGPGGRGLARRGLAGLGEARQGKARDIKFVIKHGRARQGSARRG